MNCPHCQTEIPESAIMSEAGRIATNRARGKRGRKPVLRQCLKCGRLHSAREMQRCKVPAAKGGAR